MSRVLEVDIIDGSNIEESREGLTVTRVFDVTDITGGPSARLVNAIRASGVPAYGDTHPAAPDLQVTFKRVEPHDMSQARVFVTYTATDALDVVGGREVIEVGSTPGTRTTARDKDGNLLTKQVVIEDVDDDGNVTTRTETRVAEIEEEVNLVTYIVRRREAENPARKAMKYVNSVQGLWKCTRIYGASDDGGETYSVSYELVYNPNGWRVLIEDRDESGRIRLDSTPEVFNVNPRRGLPVRPILDSLPEDAR